MHVLIPVKRVVDYNVKVRVKSDGSGVDTSGVKMSINPFDEVAVAQAVLMRQAGQASRVTVVSCGGPIAQDVLRTALAMGADAAILIDPGVSESDGPALIKALSVIVQREDVGLVLCGKQAIDDDMGDTAPMLAALLDWPQAISVNRMALIDAGLRVDCDGDQGLEQWCLPLPAVLGVDLRLCDPRPISLPNMMKAKRAAITTLPLSELVSSTAGHMRVLSCATPPVRAPGVRIEGLPQLLDRLRMIPALNAGT